MKTITSRANPLYRQWLSDVKHAGRPAHPIWLEGVHLCQAWLEHRGQPQWALFALEAQDNPEIRALTAMVDADLQAWLPQNLLAGLSTLTSVPAVVFIAEHGPGLSIPPPALQRGTCVLIDDVQDPGNVGSLLRTAAAAGVQTIYAGPGTAACWSPKVLRAGQGAQFALRIHESVDLVELVRSWQAKPNRPALLATALDNSAESLYGLQLNQDVAWVFGHEGRGVSPSLLALADHRVFIPHDTAAVESLNVGIAAAICLFEQRRQGLASA